MDTNKDAIRIAALKELAKNINYTLHIAGKDVVVSSPFAVKVYDLSDFDAAISWLIYEGRSLSSNFDKWCRGQE